VAAPRQRNTQAEKDDIKADRVPQEWKRKPAKLRHKDRDARWTVKFTKAKRREDGTAPAESARLRNDPVGSGRSLRAIA
jgi:IS5 family transposase